MGEEFLGLPRKHPKVEAAKEEETKDKEPKEGEAKEEAKEGEALEVEAREGEEGEETAKPADAAPEGRLLHLQQRRLRFRQRNRDSVISGDRRQRNQTKPNTATLVLLRRGSCCV